MYTGCSTLSNAEVRRTTGCSPLSHLVTNRRLRLFGHNARCSPREDHHRALAACIRQVPPDRKRPTGRPIHTWLRTIEADLGPLNFGLATAWRKATTRGDWRHIVDTATLQRSTLWKKKWKIVLCRPIYFMFVLSLWWVDCDDLTMWRLDCVTSWPCNEMTGSRPCDDKNVLDSITGRIRIPYLFPGAYYYACMIILGERFDQFLLRCAIHIWLSSKVNRLFLFQWPTCKWK